MKGLFKLLISGATVWFTAEYFYHLGKVAALTAVSEVEETLGDTADTFIDKLRDEKLMDEVGLDAARKRRCLRVGRDVKKYSERG